MNAAIQAALIAGRRNDQPEPQKQTGAIDPTVREPNLMVLFVPGLILLGIVIFLGLVGWKCRQRD